MIPERITKAAPGSVILTAVLIAFPPLLDELDEMAVDLGLDIIVTDTRNLSLGQLRTEMCTR